jgi:RNA polymerase sigma-70 factor (ECF subfamily)
VRDALTKEDIEEVASDVFLSLWDNADKVDKLKPYMSATARNKAKNKLRSISDSLPLEEAILIDDSATPDEMLIAENERQFIKSAVLNMEDTDRDIFLRYYYDSQTVSEIACATNINQATVKQRLSRGRKKLKLTIQKEVLQL